MINTDIQSKDTVATDNVRNDAPSHAFWQTRQSSEKYGYINPMEYLRAVFENLRLILAVTICAAALTFIFVQNIVPTYKASATLLVQPQRAGIVDVNDGLERFGRDRNEVQTQISIIKSRELISRVIGQLPNDGLTTQTDSVRIDGFLEKLSIFNIPETNLLEISFFDKNPELAATTANLVAKQYIEADLEARRNNIANSTNILDERMSILQQALRQSEKRLFDYKKQNGLLDIDNRLSRLNEQSMFVEMRELSDAKARLARLASERAAIKAARRNADDLSATVSAGADPVLNRLYSQKSDLLDQRAQLKNRYGYLHPKIVNINNRIASLDSQITRNENRVVAQLNAEYSSTSAEISSVEENLNQGKSSILDMSTHSSALGALQREVNSNRETYLGFVKSLKETNSTQGLEASIGRITEFAHIPSDPWRPNKLLILLVVTLGTFILSSVIAIAKRITRDTVSCLRMLENRLPVPLLGYTVSKKELKDSGISVPRIYKESIRSIRTRLLVDNESSVNRVMGVTSTLPGEGKTTLACDLALAMSEVKRTLIIDCDLRLPTLHNVFGLSRSASGLTDLIKGEVSASLCIHKNLVGALDVMGSGGISNQASELLMSKNFAYIIRELSKSYELIILDCPPVSAVSDTNVIGRSVDSMVVASKVDGDTTYSATSETVNRLEIGGIQVDGVIATQLDPQRLHDYNVRQNYIEYYGYMTPDAQVRDLKSKELLSLQSSERLPNVDVNVAQY